MLAQGCLDRACDQTERATRLALTDFCDLCRPPQRGQTLAHVVDLRHHLEGADQAIVIADEKYPAGANRRRIRANTRVAAAIVVAPMR